MITIFRYKFEPQYHNNFGKFFDILKFVVIFLVHLMTVFEAIVTGENVYNFFRLYNKLYTKWSKQSVLWKTGLRTYWKLFFYFVFSVVLTVSIEVNYIIQIRKKTEWLVFFCSYTPSIFICRCRILQLVMYMELIRVELSQLNLKILQSAKGTKKVQMVFFEEFIRSDLTQWAKQYDDIHELTHLVAKSMLLSILAIFVATYIKILSDCYWSYWMIYAKFEIHGKIKLSKIFEYILILLFRIYKIIISTFKRQLLMRVKI